MESIYAIFVGSVIRESFGKIATVPKYLRARPVCRAAGLGQPAGAGEEIAAGF